MARIALLLLALLLSAPALLGGRADHLDAPLREPVAERREPGARAHARRRDHVVAARVADLRERVVLAEDRDRGARAGLDRRAERRLDAGEAALDREALLAEELGEPGGGLHLLVAELGVVVDPAGQRLELVAETVHRLADLVLERAHTGSPGRAGSSADHYTTAPVC